MRGDRLAVLAATVAITAVVAGCGSDDENPIGERLVVSIGDSVASGEGTPDVPATAFNRAGWRGGVTGPASQRSATRCHRSNQAANAVAARAILGDEEPSRFVSLACSGATIKAGLIEQYKGVQPDGSPEEPQLDRLREISADREIAAVLVSIGANDLGFSKIVRFCTFNRGGPCQDSDDFPDPASPDRRLSLREYVGIAIGRLAAGYRTLAAKLRGVIEPKRVIIAEYFDPTSPPPGYASPIGCEMLGGGVRPEESEWAREHVLHELNEEIARSAGLHKWTLVEMVDERFEGHGLCARDPDRWVTTFRESVTGQGIPLFGNRTVLEALRDLFASHTGTLHPNRAGHREIAALIEPKLRDAVEGD